MQMKPLSLDGIVFEDSARSGATIAGGARYHRYPGTGGPPGRTAGRRTLWPGVRWDRSPHILFSVSKSFTGAMAGILVDQGLLDPDSPVIKYVPEVAGSAYGDCMVRQVLDMTVSSSFSEDYLNIVR